MLWAKCKSCGNTYKAPCKYGTRNMTRHMKTYDRKETLDVGQRLLFES